MALLNLVYRDQLFPREAYRLTFDRLLEKLPEKSACRLMVNLLALAHERGCEAELAALLTADLAAGQLPDIAALRARFAADPAALPEVVVHLTPLIAYEALLGGDNDNRWEWRHDRRASTPPGSRCCSTISVCPRSSRIGRALPSGRTRKAGPPLASSPRSPSTRSPNVDRRRLERHLAEAQLLPGKTLDSFDFDAVPMVSKAHVLAICAGDSWIGQGANLLLIGGPGGGKTHLASAIGLALVENGWRVLFARTSDLVQRLQVARRELALEAAINRLDRFHLLILDDLAYVSKDQAETSVLFELISARYERRSTLITANQPFGAWGKVFPDPAMTLAAVDRLVHHATIFEINVDSLSAARRARTKTEERRAATELRDNQRSRHCVAPRQSTFNLDLASDNQTRHHRSVAVTDSHPD